MIFALIMDVVSNELDVSSPQDSVPDQNQAEGQAEQRHAGEEDQSRDRGQTHRGEAAGRASGSEAGGGGERSAQPHKQVSRKCQTRQICY